MLPVYLKTEVEVLDLNAQMPIFSVDIEEIWRTSVSAKVLDKIGTADVLVVSMAENNGNYSAALKYDWCLRISGKVFQEKPMLLMSTSDGKKEQMF
jgi:NAD(P)H-dependent FMN reductase